MGHSVTLYIYRLEHARLPSRRVLSEFVQMAGISGIYRVVGDHMVT